jgi:hypothetical protein
MAAPFLDAFAEQASLQQNYKEPAGAQQMDAPPTAKGDLKIIKYREEEAIFIQASNDRVTVIFSTVFKEETDRVYGRVFLQVHPHPPLPGETRLTGRNSWMLVDCNLSNQLLRLHTPIENLP